MRALDRLPRPRMARGPSHCTRGSAAARSRAARPSAGSSAAPMIVSVAATSRRKQAPRGECGRRILFLAQMRDQHAMQAIARTCAATARARAPTGTRRASWRACAAGSARGASSCSTSSRSAIASDARVASSPAGRSRYRSVPVSATISARSGYASRHAAIAGWLRRACSAISATASAALPCVTGADGRLYNHPILRRQQPRPARGRAPVAVVGVGEIRRDEKERGGAGSRHGRTERCTSESRRARRRHSPARLSMRGIIRSGCTRT